MPFQLAGLWRNADFMKLWSAQAISVFGSTITRDALPLVAIITLTANPTQVGLLSALGMFPALLLGLPAGVWVDRLRRRPILLAADLGRALILVSIPVAALLGVLTLAQLYVAAVLAGTLTLFFNVADNSFLPAIVKRENLVEANSKLGLTDSIRENIAHTIAGSLVQ
ncbi:MAG: MFS transporter, partial [Anaerolineae bacterium]|nr:MFS transporter [Anaerolineae bacterium]